MWIMNKKHIQYVNIAQKSSVPSSATSIWNANCTDVHMNVPVHYPEEELSQLGVGGMNKINIMV